MRSNFASNSISENGGRHVERVAQPQVFGDRIEEVLDGGDTICRSNLSALSGELGM